MALFIFKYALPALLGYTLFVGIAGKFNPLHKPKQLEERPSWVLGLWTGMSVFLMLCIGLHMAYGMTPEAVRASATPSAIGIIIFLILSFLGSSLYRTRIFAELDAMDSRTQERNSSLIDWSRQVHQLDTIIGSSKSALPDTDTNTNTNTNTNTLSLLRDQLAKEKAVREETERHLRITRKALSRISNTAAEQGYFHEVPTPPHATKENSPTTDFLPSNSRLRRDKLESNVISLKRELVNAKHEIRLHVAARAKALSTANKSVAFARQSIELRARLEAELGSVQTSLINKQTTIASLINRLKRERRLTDEELAVLAGQIAVNDSSTTSGQNAAGMRAQYNARFTSGS